MQLKIKIHTVLLLFVSVILNAQEKNIELKGTVKYDSIYLQDINILNKTTGLGTSSGEDGHFTISATKGDSILISSVVYTKRTIKVSETHLKLKAITIYLEPNYNLLDEIMLEKKISSSWGDLSVTKGTIFNNDNISKNKAPDARKFTDPNAQAGGVNFVSIFKALTQKIRSKRKEKKSKQKKVQQLKDTFSTTIKNLYGDAFFIEALNLQQHEINLFLDFCVGNGLAEFYNSNEIVIKNFLIKQAREYHSIKINNAY